MSVKFEPLRWLLHPVALLAFVAAAQAWINGADVRAIITAVLGVLVAAATEAARSKVTPTAKLRRTGVSLPADGVEREVTIRGESRS